METDRRLRLSIVLLALISFFSATGSSSAETPERIVSKRLRILSHEEYVNLRDQWKAYTVAHPDDPTGWTQYARAARYAGEPCEDYISYVRKAVEVDPDCADAHATLGSYMCKQYCPSESDDVGPAIQELELALSLDPSLGDPHYSLWGFKLQQEDRAGAAKHLRALVQGSHMPEFLLDLGYNLLVGLEPDAIILTNGDDDTYPPLALQAAHELRTDVAIVNLSLLNLHWYREEMRRGPHTVPLPLLDPKSDNKLVCGDLPSNHAVRGLIENLEKVAWQRPLYVAVTVDLDRIDFPNKLSLEGLAYRVLPEKGEEREVNLVRLGRNLKERFRLESATSLGFDWDWHSALRMLSMNYAAAYAQLASGLAEAGDSTGARDAFREGLRLCEFHSYGKMGCWIADCWLEWEESSKEAARWKEKLGG